MESRPEGDGVMKLKVMEKACEIAIRISLKQLKIGLVGKVKVFK
jgi:hypothetical protein